ncbi:UNVERIFIED_CONTAM: hypothetical protein GTU68_014131 [Idotea baltica]|nr:hypothetical protein [Idotea baltica]
MKFWIRTCILLCLYGFFKELRPSEPFLTEYLLGPYHNLTESQVYYDVYPVWTYSYLSLLVVVFLCTDLLRYKPVIVFEGIGYVATWCLLLWARDVHWMQLMEFCYGIATSTEVAYFTYMYAQVDGEYYQKITSYTRSAILAGRFFSGLSAQVLYSTGAMDYHSLNYFSLTSVSVALGISFFLPPVRRSIYFHREPPSDAEEMTVKGLPEGGEKDLKDPPAAGEKGLKDLSSGGGKGVESSHNIARDKNSFLKKFKQWTDFQEAYSNKTLVKWSVWWAFATCVNFQVGNYIQPLWESIFPFQESESLYNGAVEATSTFLGRDLVMGCTG